jgi:UDP-N-acetylmuramoylalanine--D-glutamate ligase
MELEGKHVVVVGLARSGVAAARFLASRGARVVATDRKPEGELEAEALTLEQHGIRLELGEHRPATLASAQLVVVSPGVPWQLPELEAARRAGVPVMAELELGFRFLRGGMAAVTGTKGKSTTTAALGAMLREAGRDVRVGGNIGDPLTGLLDGATDRTVYVLEVSSFQLEGTQRFRPNLALFLNLSADHLDRHASFEDYAAAKALVFRNQQPSDWAVVNGDDPGVVALARQTRARRVSFHAGSADPSRGPAAGTTADAAYFEGGEARLRFEGRVESLFPLASVQLPGAHLAADLLAAACGAHLLGVPSGAVARAVARFQGVPHVLERVADVAGVRFFNDSKATNVAAARMSLEALDPPLVAILGGRYKGGDFALLKDVVRRRVKAVVAIGEASERVAEALAPAAPVVRCAGLRDAVERAYALCVPGDSVVLAPGCSSFDMFRDYAERGDAFKAEVRRLAQSVRETGK